MVYTYKMITQNTLRTCEEIQVFHEINFIFVTAFDVNRCVKQIKLPILLHTCSSISGLPSKKYHKYHTGFSLSFSLFYFFFLLFSLTLSLVIFLSPFLSLFISPYFSLLSLPFLIFFSYLLFSLSSLYFSLSLSLFLVQRIATIRFYEGVRLDFLFFE